MNEREIRRLVQPLLERNSDLAYFGRAIFLTPVTHFLRAVLFERMGAKSNVELSVEVQPAFSGSKCISMPFKKYIWPKDGMWQFGKEITPQSMYDLVEKECLSVLREVRSFEEFTAVDTIYYADGYASTYMRRAVIALAQGRFGDAGAIFAKWDFAPQFDWRVGGYGSRLAREGDGLPLEDKREIIRILHRNEAEAMRAMKLEKHWIPTPFPAEEQGLV